MFNFKTITSNELVGEVIAGGIVTVFSVLIGGWDTTLQVLLILMGLDVLTGCLKSWKANEFQSRSFREGILSKAGFFLVLILAYQVDVMMGNREPIIRTATSIYYIGVEGTSLIENLGMCGIPIPGIVKRHLKAFQDQGEAEAGSKGPSKVKK